MKVMEIMKISSFNWTGIEQLAINGFQIVVSSQSEKSFCTEHKNSLQVAVQLCCL